MPQLTQRFTTTFFSTQGRTGLASTVSLFHTRRSTLTKTTATKTSAANLRSDKRKHRAIEGLNILGRELRDTGASPKRICGSSMRKAKSIIRIAEFRGKNYISQKCAVWLLELFGLILI